MGTARRTAAVAAALIAVVLAGGRASAHAESNVMPDLTGCPVLAAALYLEQRGMTVTMRGVGVAVAAQDPPAGHLLAAGALVRLVARDAREGDWCPVAREPTQVDDPFPAGRVPLSTSPMSLATVATAASRAPAHAGSARAAGSPNAPAPSGGTLAAASLLAGAAACVGARRVLRRRRAPRA